jgi:hypothetical protein
LIIGHRVRHIASVIEQRVNKILLSAGVAKEQYDSGTNCIYEIFIILQLIVK